MTVLMGYCDRISAMPGETIRFMVSCRGTEGYRADIVRVLNPEAGPDATPFRTEAIDVAANGEYPARRQDIHIGSWAVVPASPLISALESFTLQAMVSSTLPGTGRQALMGTWSEARMSGYGLGLDDAGALELRLGDGAGAVEAVSTGVPLRTHKWYFVAASFDAGTGAIELVQEPLADKTFGADPGVHMKASTTLRPAPGPGPFLFAAWHKGEAADREPPEDLLMGCHYNGKIDRPRLANRVLDRAEMASLAGAAVPAGLERAVIAAWDFARDISSERILDLSPNRLDGETVNLPTRAVTGHNWTAEEMNWQRAPEQYGAIHFHEDDLYDAGWSADFSLTVPKDMRSGCYAARLRAGEAEFYVVFFVRPPRGTATANIAYLAATATYTVYQNNVGRFTNKWVEVMKGVLTQIDATDTLLLDHPELGLSTYDVHRDGSGVCYSSRLRPAMNTRPTGRLWNYCSDLFVVDWLEQIGLGYDVITDDDLHAEGLGLLQNYRVVVTGGHPEYYSIEMLDALDAWLRAGGRLMYMGGNGFYWRIAYHPTKPGVIEVRRAEDGTRAWIAEVGEYYHSFTGEYGGMLRRQKRAPNALVGVGFISQGFDASAPYRRTPESRDARATFIFDGIDDEVLGDFGVMLGGAAGAEIDCVDPTLGTPPHALVVASSENHSNTYFLVNEEVAAAIGTMDGVQNPAIRADMVFFETEGGGAVFSTGSIAYSGSLGANGFDNNIARLTTNVLKRFVDETPFEMPDRVG